MYNPYIEKHNLGVIELGPLEYDASCQRITAGEETVYLRNKLNELLFYLVVNNHRVISRDELIDTIWHGNYYTGIKGVTHSVCKLRKTLQQLGVKNIQICTFPKQGYALTIN
jgi:DNA-binding winged helix-turn-helix (wHTH) protein